MSKYIVKLEFCDTPNMVLVKNVEGYKRGNPPIKYPYKKESL